MDWWKKLMEINKQQVFDTILSKVVTDDSNPMARTIASRIIAEKLFEKLEFPQRFRTIVDIEAFEVSRKFGEKLYKKLPRKMRKQIEKEMKIDVPPFFVIIACADASLSYVKDEIDRIISILNIDMIEDKNELLLYARDLTLYYFFEIKAIAKVYHTTELEALKAIEVVIEKYLRTNKIII